MEKYHAAIMHGSGGVLGGKERVLSTLMTEVVKGIVGPMYEVRTEKVAPMPIRNEADLLATCVATLHLEKVMEVAQSRICQSSTRLRTEKAENGCGTCASWVNPL